jgi:hypothetical protein
MQELIIDRSKWRTGGSGFAHALDDIYGTTYLLNPKGFMCCLGFFCLQIENRTPDEILGVPDPVGLDNITRGSNLIGDDGFNKPWVSSAININDGGGLSKETREERIQSIFKENGFDVKFINKYPK